MNRKINRRIGSQKNELYHIGVARRSGRYPWGSGEDPYQDRGGLNAYYNEMRSKGMSETDIAKSMGLNTRQLREQRSIARAEKRAADERLATTLKDKGWSNTAIGTRMGINESSVRALLNPTLKERAASTAVTADILKKAVDSKQYIDIGTGVEQHLGISRTKLNTAVARLVEEGYTVHNIKTYQVGSGKLTTIKVLAPPGATLSDVSKNRDKLQLPDSYSENLGRSFLGLEPIKSVSSDRILIKYDEDGGSQRDGVIQLRRGVEDIDLGDASYAQVRIGVNDTHYMKGMAIYADDIPDGYDIVYNTNKSKTVPPEKVFKAMTEDSDNPFGSTVRQKHYIDADGNTQLSALNIVGSKDGSGEEGSWNTWSKSISSQVLSKQTPALAKQQLDLARKLKEEELDDILKITNPTVKKALLNEFADSAESSAVNLKAAALPRQATQVLLPFLSVKENEVYAPNFRDGEQVALIRHPHGGIFEIPVLVVNNKNSEAIGTIGNAKDAIGINPKVAQKLSGADFDGDTVIVIPNNKGVIKTAPSIKALQDFDPKVTYKAYPGMPKMSNSVKQMEMGKVSNLITDMTLKGASFEEIARAVKHSMTVIDAEKHHLDYQRSFDENGIAALKKKYQGRSNAGASTLISRAKSLAYIPERKEGRIIEDPVTGKKKRVFVDPVTGDKLYENTNAVKINKQGKVVSKISKVELLSTKKDARSLSSGTVIESVYANHSNALKDLARKARLAALKTKDIPYNNSARKTFSDEVSSLKSKLSLALRNKPNERKAQVMANAWIAQKRSVNKNMTPSQLKKLRAQALEEARTRFGAKKSLVEISDREWLAIQAGAVSPSNLARIIANSDKTRLKTLATPRKERSLSVTKTIVARSMLDKGYTRSEVADALAISVGMLDTIMTEEQ